MTAWRHSRIADLGLRALGVILCGVAYWAISTLYAIRQGSLGEDPDVLCFGLAAAGFLTASAGAALLCVGHHIFDEIKLSVRYRQTKYLTTIDKE